MLHQFYLAKLFSKITILFMTAKPGGDNSE
jgi:hypothetical protein